MCIKLVDGALYNVHYRRAMSEKQPVQYLTYKYRLLPTKRQHAALAAILEDQRHLYNAALEERIDCYRKTGRGRSYIDQCKALTEWRNADDNAAATPANLQRWTLRRLDEAFAAFFRRVKERGGKVGFPRFRGKGRWSSFGFAEFSGIRLDGTRLRWRGLAGAIRVHMHRPLPIGTCIKSCVFRRDHKGWSVCFYIAVDAATEQRPVSKMIGLDLGLAVFACASNGDAIPNPRIALRADREARRKRRALSRCRRGSSRRKKVKARLTKLHAKIANTRATWLHQQSAWLVRDYDLIAVEKLNVKGLAKTNLARSVHDASWSDFIAKLRYKAERAGAQLIEVDPKFTSQDCSGCRARVPKALAVRTHSCPFCGLVLDRDHNAALNVLHKAVAGLGTLNVAGCGERAPRNLMEATI